MLTVGKWDVSVKHAALSSYVGSIPIHGTREKMTTLTTKDGIVWTCLSHHGRVAFGHNEHAINYEPSTGYFHLKEKGETLSVSKSPAFLLETANEYIWEHYASQFIPSWEAATHSL